MPQTQTVRKVGPDGQTYDFPAGTTDSQVAAYFKRKGITAGHPSTGTPAASAIFSTPGVNPFQPAPATSVGDDSILGGMAKEFYEGTAGAATGLAKTIFTPPHTKLEQTLFPNPGALAAYRILRGMGKSEADAAAMTKQIMGRVPADLRGGDVAGAASDIGRGAVQGASMLDPFATAPVTNVNRLEEEGRNREAIGEGSMDALLLGLGAGPWTKEGKLAREGREYSYRTGQLANVLGHDPELVKNLPPLTNDIMQTAKGRIVGNVGHVAETLADTDLRFDTEFNNALAPIGRNRVMPNDIVQRLRIELNKIPTEQRQIVNPLTGRVTTKLVGKTAEADAEFRRLNEAIIDYSRPWSYNQLNQERMMANRRLNPFYEKGSQGQYNALSRADTIVYKAVRDGAAQEVYDAMDKYAKANGVPDADFAALKRKQGQLWSLQDQLTDRINELSSRQLVNQGKFLREKIKPRIYIGAGGPHAFTRLENETGDLNLANKHVAAAFGNYQGPWKAWAFRRMAMGLPISAVLSKNLRQQMDQPLSESDKSQSVPVTVTTGGSQ